MANGGAEGEPSQNNALSDTLSGDKSSPKAAIADGEGPGLTALRLSRVKERLRNLGTAGAIPPQEREHLRGFYTHERSKLQLRLAVLGKTEKVKSCEGAFEEARRSLDSAQSEGGEDEIRKAESHYSLAEATLTKARSELQTASAELARLRAADGCPSPKLDPHRN